MRDLLAPMGKFLEAMANARAEQWSDDPVVPSVNAAVSIPEMDVYVDLTQFIDVAAEISRNEKLLANLVKQIQGKEGRLSNESFVSRAPAISSRKNGKLWRILFRSVRPLRTQLRN